MTPELVYLTWSAGLAALLWMPYMLMRFAVWGIPMTVGYPMDPPPLPLWATRSYRAHMNMVENLVVFATLVLVAHAAGINTATTALGAAIFFWARVAHAIVHILGLPWLRTLAFLAGWAGSVMIFIAIVAA